MSDIIVDTILGKAREGDSLDPRKPIIIDGIPVRVLISADTFPEPNADRIGIIALYTGSTTPQYTRGDFYRCVQQGSSYIWKHLEIDALPLGQVHNIRCITQNNQVRIKFMDADDLYDEDVLLAKWARTIVVRKEGSLPTSWEDGTVVLQNTIRNQYASNPFFDIIPDTSITYYYAFFSFTEEDAVSFGGQCQTGELTWTAIQDSVRGGEQIFEPGDELETTVKKIDLSADQITQAQVLGYDGFKAAPLQFARYAALDSGSAKAWRCADENYTIYTDSESVTPNQDCYYDTDLTVVTCVAVLQTSEILVARPKHTLDMCYKRVLDNLAFCPGELEWGLTRDVVFAPDAELDIHLKGSTSVTHFVQCDEEDGYFSTNGQYHLFMLGTTWVIYQCSAGEHVNFALYDTLTSGELIGGTWLNGTTVANGKKYYKIEEGIYVEQTVTKGETVPPNTYYEHRPDTNRQYGWSRWKYSPLRKYCNSSGTGWYSEGSPFSQQPAYVSNNGFLDRVETSLLSVVGTTEVKVARNTAADGGGYDVVWDRFFLLSRKELYGQNEDSGCAEGTQAELYVGVPDTSRAKQNLAGQDNAYFLRSPFTGISYDVRYCSATSGSLGRYNALSGFGFSPAYSII